MNSIIINSSVCLLIILEKGNQKKLFGELCNSEIINNGTGFFIDPNGLIATANHVIKCEHNEAVFAVLKGKLIPVEIIKRYELLGDGGYNDYALCKAPLSTQNHFKLSASKISNSQEQLRVLGFSKHVKSKNNHEVKFKDGKMYYNEISGILFKLGIPKIDGLGPFENGFIMLYDESFTKYPSGMSGGPVVNLKGEVVGLLFRGSNLTGALCLNANKLIL